MTDHHPRRAARVRLALPLLGLGLLAGCSILDTRPAPDITYARGYPAQLRQGETLDIQVVRDGTTIRITNTSATALGPGTLWVNRWYSRPIDGLGVGEAVTLPLGEFRDEFGEAFRAGGFFASEDADIVVLTQYETTQAPYGTVLYGLVVVGGGEAE